MKQSKQISAQRILVIPLRYIGDTVLTVPLVRNLRRLFPEATLDLLASPATADLMAPCPYLNHVHLEPKSLGERLALLRRYDTVFMLRKSVSLALLCKLAGVKTLVGYDKQRFPFGYKRGGWFLDRTARYPGLKTDTPQALSHLGLLAACGLTVQDDHLELWATDTDRQNVDALLARHGLLPEQPLAALHAASASHGKQIDLIKFADGVRQLSVAGYAVLATGTRQDRTLYEQLQAEPGISLVNLAGETSLRETFALYQKIQLLLTVDSSPIHLAAAAGVSKIVGVFGPTNERQWAPHAAQSAFRPVFVDLPCRPCYAKVCSHNNCKVTMTGEQIADGVRSLL